MSADVYRVKIKMRLKHTYLEPITISVFGRIATAHILCAGCNMTCCSELCQTFRYLSSPPVTTNELVISVPQKTLKLYKTKHKF